MTTTRKRGENSSNVSDWSGKEHHYQHQNEVWDEHCGPGIVLRDSLAEEERGERGGTENGRHKDKDRLARKDRFYESAGGDDAGRKFQERDRREHDRDCPGDECLREVTGQELKIALPIKDFIQSGLNEKYRREESSE